MSEYYVKVDIPHIIKVNAATPEDAMRDALIYLKYPETQPHSIQIIEQYEPEPAEAIEQPPQENKTEE